MCWNISECEQIGKMSGIVGILRNVADNDITWRKVVEYVKILWNVVNSVGRSWKRVVYV